MSKKINNTGCFIGVAIGASLTIFAVFLFILTGSISVIFGFCFVLLIVAVQPFLPKLKTIPDLNIGVVLGMILIFMILITLIEFIVFLPDN